MATETRHAGLTADERSTIRSTVLKARETIENDLYRQLERYGVYDDERVDIDALGHLDAYDRQTRGQIDAALDRELEATDDDYERSVKNYVREATKTYLNRLVALKAIEVRGLVTETMIKRPEYGNRSEMHRTVDEVAGELVDQPDNGLGAALELAFTELTDEIGVIFEESEYTSINLDFTVREEIIEQLNDINESVWESDEAMGWVYQYFGEKEREEIDDRIDKENYKVQDTDVATKTQLFTPRYIVEWMVDNSLGRLWLEMHGDITEIDTEENCFYLAPLEESLTDREAKNVRDITVLDPACGSGHMLFYAFDVLYEMYLEQGDVAEKYIPQEILKHNLYGIDIDPGAAQLAALSLYVKAKSKEPDVEIEKVNIVSADAVLVNGEKKEEVLARAETELEKRVLEQVWRSFEHIREWGSLVRIEERIEEIIEEELEEVRATGQTQFTDEGLAKQSSVISYSGEEESWEHVKERLLEQVSELAEEALVQNDPIEEMFVGEVEKSVRLLDLFIENYDVVVSNPPYLGSGKMENSLKEFIKNNYKSNKDLYAAFIERCIELSEPEGYVSMITREEFMFLYSFRGFRKKLLTETQLIEALHLKRYGFLNQKDIFTVGFVIKNTPPDNRSMSRFYQLTNDINEYSSYSGKINGLEKIVESQRKAQPHPHTYTIDQNLFLQVGRTPLIYWFGRPILDLFNEYSSLGEIGEVKVGLQTSDDDRFVRRWWEIDESKIGDDYKWYVLGGDDNEYYDSAESTIYWENDGEEVINYDKSYPRNKDYYHLEGVNFRKFSKVFTARYQPPNQIFSDATRFVYIEECDDFALLGLLCSSLTRFIMYGLNPSLNFQAGDAKRLPINEEVINNDRVSKLTQKAISIRKEQFAIKETKFEFSGQNLLDNARELNLFTDLNEAYVQILHGKIDNIIFEEYGISNNIRENIYSELPKNISKHPHVKGIEVDHIETDAIVNKIEKISISDNEIDNLVSEISKIKGESIRNMSEETNISPYTIAMLRYEYNLYTDDEIEESAARLVSYYVGCLMGRWQKEQVDSSKDGILAFDELFENNISAGIRDCIKLTFNNAYEIESELESKLGRNPIDWLRNRFFRYHHCKEYRRRGQRIPIYWQLGSDEGAFSCFVYYHAMDNDTLPKLRGQYVDVKLDTLQNRLDAIESELDTAEGDRARELRSEREEIQADVDDIHAFRDRLDELIDEGFEPDFEAGIWENIQKVDEHDLLAVSLDKL